MAERSVTVRLKAEIGQYKAAMNEAGAAAQKAGSTAQGSFDKASAGAAKAGGAFKGVAGDMDQFGNKLTEADAAAGRYVNSAGRVVEANGKFASGFTANTEAAKAYRDEMLSGMGTFEKMAYLQREHSAEWDTMANAAVVGGAAMTAAVGGIVAKYASFDKAMSGVQASTHASAGEMERLREVAMRAGADTAYSGEEAAKGIEELAKAGISTADIIGGGLSGALSLAAAGQIEVGEAAELAATAMTQFKLEGSDVGHVADLLAAGAGKAQGSVGDLGYALNQSGLVASQAGISIEETVGTLSAFASAGLVGSDAGTSFKTMLQKLQNPSKEAQAALDELGISMYDSKGEFVGMASLADQLKTSMQDLTPAQRDAAMATIFGSDAVRAANVLYAQGGEGIQDWIGKVNDAGYAAETAAALQDNLAGDIEKLGGAFDTLALQSGGNLNDFFRTVVQGATGLLDVIGSIPGPVLTTTAALAGMAGTGALVAGGIMKGVSAAAEFKGAVDALGISLPDADSKMGKLGRTAAAAGVSFAIVSTLMDKAFEGTESAAIGAERMGNALAGSAGNLDSLNASFRNAEWANGNGSAWQGSIDGINGVGDAITNVQGLSWAEELGSWGAGLFGVSDNTAKLKEDVANLDTALAGMASGGSLDEATAAFKSIADETRAAGGDVEGLRGQFPELEGAILDYASSLGVTLTEQETLGAMMGDMPPKLTAAADAAAQAEGGMGDLAGGMGELGEVAEETSASLEDVMGALTALGLAQMGMTEAQGAYSQSVRDLGTALAENTFQLNATGTAFDVTTESGYAAQQAFNDVAESGFTMAEAMANNGASQAELQGAMQQTYNDLVNSATQFGLTSEQADILARATLGIPTGVDIETFMSDAAKSMAEATETAVTDIPDSDHVESSMSTSAREEAEATRMAVDNIPNRDFIDSGMSTLARFEANSTHDAVVRVPDSKYVGSSMSGAARDMANETQGAIGRIERNVHVEVSTIQRISTIGSFAQPSSGAGRGPAIGRFTGGFASPARGLYTGGLAGGQLRGFARGGLLPGTPPSNPMLDNLRGMVADTGEPIMLRSREYVVNEPGTHRGANLSWLRWMNSGGTMAAPPRGFATGGSPANGNRASVAADLAERINVNISMMQPEQPERFSVRVREGLAVELAKIGR